MRREGEISEETIKSNAFSYYIIQNRGSGVGIVTGYWLD
jgi:hypothetical protein